jgi:hypothetical protein
MDEASATARAVIGTLTSPAPQMRREIFLRQLTSLSW